MKVYSGYEGITRKVNLAERMTMSDVVIKRNPDFPTAPPTFSCRPLLADISAITCRANWERGVSSCIGCAVGECNTAVVPKKAVKAQSGSVVYSNRPARPCVRCLKDGFGDSGKRTVGRVRMVALAALTVPNGSQSLTLCIGCFNRARELRAGRNSKGVPPRKVSCLREVIATYKVGTKLYKDVPLGLRSGTPEVLRLLERSYPGTKVKLIRGTFGGEPMDVGSQNDPLLATVKWRQMVRPAVEKKVSPAMAAVLAELDDDAPSISPAWHQVFGDPARETKRRGISSWSVERQAEYADSLLAAIREAQKDPYGMRDLAQWLLEGIPSGPWLYVAPAHKPAEASAPVADAIAPANVAEPVSTSIELVAEATLIQGFPGDAEPSEWDGCFVETDGVRVYVTAYAAEHGISDWDAAIELGVCEPEGAEPDEQPAPEQIPEPAFIERTKRLTKKEKKALKKSERAERQAQAQPKRPSNPRQIAVTARAFIKVMYAIGARK